MGFEALLFLLHPYPSAFRLSPGRDPLSAASLFSRLFAPDDFHPSRLGTYLAACVFALVLTGVSPLGSPFRPARCGFDDRVLEKNPGWEGEWPAAVSDVDAARLQRAAHAAVGARRPEQTFVRSRFGQPPGGSVAPAAL